MLRPRRFFILAGGVLLFVLNVSVVSADSDTNQPSCSKSRYQALQAIAKQWCSKMDSGSCSNPNALTCSELQKRADAAEACSDALNDLNKECYQGKDSSKSTASDNARRTFQTCMRALAQKNC